MPATSNERIVARWTHPRGKAFVNLFASDPAPGVGGQTCYAIRSDGMTSIQYFATDAEAIREVERRNAIGLYTPDTYKTGLVRSAVAPTLCVRCAPLYPVRPMLPVVETCDCCLDPAVVSLVETYEEESETTPGTYEPRHARYCLGCYGEYAEA
jgi:hypothetical protein